jgi:hypothetical protein
MLDKEDLNKRCKDAVRGYVETNFDSSSDLFLIRIRECMSAAGVLAQITDRRSRGLVEEAIIKQVRDECSNWVKRNGSTQELVTWLEGFVTGVVCVIPVCRL